MINPQEITLLLYNITLLPVIFFSIFFLIIAFLNIFIEREKKYPFSKKQPFITVQIPVYNDDIAARCIQNCIEFSYPKNRYEIIIADDSTNKKIAAKLEKFSEKFPKLVKYCHRDNRQGFKPGALENIMPITKGEIIVIFDSDWTPQKDFLNKIIQPLLADKKIAIVQAKQTFVNLKTNLVTRFASYLLIIYHSLMMPINNKINTVFFCGTAGAIRKDILIKVGGWNTGSLTEDADLSVRILSQGYKTCYLNLPVPSEVPETIEGFIKQQMRWCYGLTRTFIDNLKNIAFSSKLNLPQKLMISYNTMGNIIAPLVILMTFFGTISWFLGEPQLFKIVDLADFILKFLMTSGFLLLGGIALMREGQIKEFPYLVLGAFSISLVMVTFNAIAFFMAVMQKPLFWYRTPKSGNIVKQDI